MSRSSSFHTQLCKHYQNITSRLVFLIVFRIHYMIFKVFPVRLKTCRSNGFLFFTRQNVGARKIKFCPPDRLRAHNLSKPAIALLKNLAKGKLRVSIKATFQLTIIISSDAKKIFFDKKTSGNGIKNIPNKEFAEELHTHF